MSTSDDDKVVHALFEHTRLACKRPPLALWEVWLLRECGSKARDVAMGSVQWHGINVNVKESTAQHTVKHESCRNANGPVSMYIILPRDAEKTAVAFYSSNNMHVRHYCMIELHEANQNERCGWHAANIIVMQRIYVCTTAPKRCVVALTTTLGLCTNVSRYYIRGPNLHAMVGAH